MALYLEVKADTNDADYITKRTKISKETLKRFIPLIETIKNKDGHNWVTSEYGSDPAPEIMYTDFRRLVKSFRDYVPYGEYGVHTIKSIKLLDISKEEDLL